MISPNWDEQEDPISSEQELNPLSSYWMEGDSLAPPCQAEMDVVSAILELADPSESDILFDLGCGDGRIPLEASLRYGCVSTGIEIEEKLVTLFHSRIERMQMGHKVSVIAGDLQIVDLGVASIIVVYLLPEAIECIKDKLTAWITQGNRKMVCNTWGPKQWLPIKKVNCGFSNNVSIYLYDSSSIPTTASS